MKSFEISSQTNKKGKRKFKAILYRIFPDSCVDEVQQIGTMYNRNGITWLREYCENALASIPGMFIRGEFLDESRTELHGHGLTGVEDNMPVYEDAVTLGVFTKGYIDEIEDDDGTLITVCIGEGEIDAQCYHNFVKKLETDMAHGYTLSGSVEICHTDENDSIVYKYGYKEFGRIPTEFIHSGYALLGVTPADDNAILMELNQKHKEDSTTMSELEIQALADKIASQVTNNEAKMETCIAECNAKVDAANAEKESVIAEKNELEATVEDLQKALEGVKADLAAANQKITELWDERCALDKALAEAQAKERLAELNNVLAKFTDEEKSYAKDEIEAFKADPISAEINSIEAKIYAVIGQKAKEASVVAEQNSHQDTIEDIFGTVESNDDVENDDIF